LVLSVLRIAATEILVLGHSAHGVVDGAVDAVEMLSMARAKGYVNAVSRNLASTPKPALTAMDSFPRWMGARLEGAFPMVEELFASLNEPVRPGLRARNDSTFDASPVVGIPSAFYAEEGTDIEALSMSGHADVIDPASTAVAVALDVAPGDVVADLAAAPGGKTRAIADQMSGEGMLVASDRHRTRLAGARRRSADLDHVEWLRLDASHLPYREASFDKVLLDAPCTGLGTVRRRPEIRHRIEPDAPQRYGEVQREMLVNALTLVTPGGRLVYSVCTMFEEETTDAIASLGGRPPDMAVGDVMGDGLMLTPLNAGTDGMFIAVFDR
jgi:16S rRNA (cytosine967-C5)-methyltransferase